MAAGCSISTDNVATRFFKCIESNNLQILQLWGKQSLKHVAISFSTQVLFMIFVSILIFAFSLTAKLSPKA
jgi:hypothetical protein